MACNSIASDCEEVQEWNVQNYRIVKFRCPDLVLAHYYTYDIHKGNKTIGGSQSQTDSCVITCQADEESFLTLNICNNSIQELKPHKVFLETKSIDSITIYSNELNQTQILTHSQTEKFVHDWNKSNCRNYSVEPLDSAFSNFPAYQYKLTVFSKENNRDFYGYNYLILDSSRWVYEMSKSHNLKYFHKYWKR